MVENAAEAARRAHEGWNKAEIRTQYFGTVAFNPYPHIEDVGMLTMRFRAPKRI